MPQQSGPIVNKDFTDVMWRSIVGEEPAIVGDVDGTAYKLNLPTGSNTVTLGTPSQDSTSVVAGFMHRIPAGQTEELPIPDAGGVARTDIIAVRYDPAWSTTEPGPCRLYRIPGGSGSGRPAYDAGPPGAEDMPLYAITRQPNQALTQAAVVDLRVRRGPTLIARGELPAAAPLGTQVLLGPEGDRYLRTLTVFSHLNTGQPTWVKQAANAVPLLGAGFAQSQVLSNGRPPAGADFRQQVGIGGPVTTDTSGYARLTYPVSFPNGLLAALLWNADTWGGLANVELAMEYQGPWGPGTRTELVYRCLRDGTPLAGWNHRPGFVLYGW